MVTRYCSTSKPQGLLRPGRSLGAMIGEANSGRCECALPVRPGGVVSVWES
jgi:hypothetical protein